ncbi:hypothetical protein [Marinobacter sp.]|uniref:hypothetical protein n=1 Tax=Marinobacter sp. TaxID=50741 RepID=UPI00199AB350|nr:hypothetical protein [Marinobacter sp.]MBD3656602.1 hypothetical protein [Marinobacter sp.]
MRIQPDSVYALGCLAAREVAVSALGTIYAVSTAGNDTAGAFTPLTVQGWSLATG